MLYYNLWYVNCKTSANEYVIVQKDELGYKAMNLALWMHFVKSKWFFP